MDKFWKFVKNEAGDTELVIDGVIASQSWWGDEVTPKAFRKELAKHDGNIIVRINSPGGDVFAGVSIYNALVDHDGKVVVKVEALAASAASFIAMAGEEIIMLPGSMMMIHNPWTFAMGNSEELAKVVEMLEKTGESIASIYVARTGQSEQSINDMLKAETWMTAQEAVDLGFATEALEAKKPATSDLINNVSNYMKTVQNAIMQPAMSIKAKSDALEVEELNVPDPTKAPVKNDIGPSKTPIKTEKTETTEVVEPVVPENNQSTEGTTMTEEQKKAQAEKDAAAANQVIAPVNQADVTTVLPNAGLSAYLKSKVSMEDFAETLRDNAGKSAEEVKTAWKEILIKNGLTDPDYFVLPEPLITAIEDAVKASGIYNVLNHTGLDVYKTVWDDADEDDDTSRAGGHNKGDTKDEQVLDFDKRVIRAKYIYKYLVLDKETIREQKSTGALIRFVLNELPVRIIREIERAVVIGDGRSGGNKRHITSFLTIKADVVADNKFATGYAPQVGETKYETLVRALALIEQEGPVYLVAKKGYTTDLVLEKNSNDNFIWAPGTDVTKALGFAGKFEPTWFNDTTDTVYDAYIVVFSAYKTVGDNSIESFTDFKLETNENEFLQEIYKGGGLSGRIAAVGVEASNS